MRIRIEGLTKSYGSTRIVDGLDLDIADGEFFTLLGASGSGKTTTLRLLAGLERPDGGRMRFDEALVSDAEAGRFTPPERRGLGMVFQSYALWPHLSVQGNLALGLREQRLGAGAIERKIAEAMALVGLTGLEQRFPDQLSGGQQQRVALARALAQQPKILLFDEPLSNLDAKLREQMRNEIRALQQRLHITAVYVTHDQAEAMAISDRIGVMERGRLLQVASPAELYQRPASTFVAGFLGLANLIEGTAQDGVVRVGGCALTLDHPVPAGPVTLMIRPEQVRFTDGPDGPNAVAARIVSRTLLGNLVDYEIDASPLHARLRVQTLSAEPAREGAVNVALPTQALRPLPG